MSTHKSPGTEQAHFQFGLKHLLLVITALCAFFATAAAFGIVGTYIFCVAAGILSGIYLRNLACVVVTLLLAAMIGCPLYQRLRESHNFLNPYPVCQPHLRRLALAMHQYNDAHGSLPPAYLADANGKPMHSWRVLLLPYLGTDAAKLYNQYDFTESWDGPNNGRLAKHMPKFFACPQVKYRGKHDTSYVVVTGKETVFNADQSMSLDQLAAMDGTSVTLLVVECAESGIHWMQPRDLPYDRMTLKINDPARKKGVRSHHLDGANVTMADASCKFVSQRVDPAAWKAAFTADGGEKTHF